MGKTLTLLFIILLTLGSLAGYLFLTEKINGGNLKIAAGKKQLEQGEQMLAQGKAKLANGKQQLSQVKRGYSGIKKTSYVWAAALPLVGGVAAVVGNKIVSSKISEGDQMVAEGSKKVKAGEEQLNAGKLELQRGVERLGLANKIRIACAVGTVLFASLLIVLGFCWRRSVIKFLKFTKY